MQVTLISPYPSLEAFGLRTLSACLKAEGCRVQMVFLPQPFNRRYEPGLLREVAELSRESAYVGLSLMTNFFDNAVQITQSLKQDRGLTVLWGGTHPTVRPEECLDYADVVCLGEGEETVVELTRRLAQGRPYQDVDGLWFRTEAGIVGNPVRPLIQDLDALPFPDYDYEGHYLAWGGRLRPMTPGLLQEQLGGVYTTMASRGCPFGCAYCFNNALNKMYPRQRVVRKRSVENLIAELRLAKERLPFLERIKLDDDAFFLVFSLDEIREFSQEYRRLIGLPLAITGISPSTLTREKLSFLVEAGLSFARLGIQTGSERTRKLYNRQQSNEGILEAARIIHEFADRTQPPQYDIILDNPWESEADLVETLRFLAGLPVPYRLCTFSLDFYPGTELYEKARQEGLVKDDLEQVYRHDYLSCRPTYLNRLFFLLDEYAAQGRAIPERRMALLTSPILRKLGLSRLLYRAARLWISHRAVRLRYMLREGARDLRRGDWRRIRRYLGRGRA